MGAFRLFAGHGAGLKLVLVVAGAALLPGVADAAIFNSPTPAAAASSLSFKGAPGTFTGKWAYRSIAIAGDPKLPLAKMSLGTSEFDLIEQGGKITGTRPAGKGKTYVVDGFAVYGPRRAPQIVLHSVSDVGGKSYEYDYFGYLMPSWNVTGSQPDTFMGTVVRTDPGDPSAPAVVVSFIATREADAAAADAPKPAGAKPVAAKPVAAHAASGQSAVK
ncbi:MAG TPA: hypothetical protein VL418_11755 [Devosiaceae bacterium]|nr:hypothetical protein [Devosiaceae bacterium]